MSATRFDDLLSRFAGSGAQTSETSAGPAVARMVEPLAPVAPPQKKKGENNSHTSPHWTPGPVMCPARVQPQTRMVERLGHMGHLGHHKKQTEQDRAGPAHEVETLLAALTDTGRSLGPELARHLRKRLAPLSRRVRAELVAVIDDAFEVAPNLETARRQAHHLLSNARALDAAKAVWPAYPEPSAPVANIEPLAPWLAHIVRHCDLAPEDRRYLLHHLAARPHDEAMRLAHRYVEAWAAGADAEPAPHRRANAGRRAANSILIARPTHRGTAHD